MQTLFFYIIEFITVEGPKHKMKTLSWWMYNKIGIKGNFFLQVLVRRCADGSELRGRIVETEAYPGGEDKASHSAGGKRTERNTAMFMKPGTIYVYPIYGIYLCMNVSSEGTFTTHPQDCVLGQYCFAYSYCISRCLHIHMMGVQMVGIIVFRSNLYLSQIEASQRFLVFITG